MPILVTEFSLFPCKYLSHVCPQDDPHPSRVGEGEDGAERLSSELINMYVAASEMHIAER